MSCQMGVWWRLVDCYQVHFVTGVLVFRSGHDYLLGAKALDELRPRKQIFLGRI